MRKDPANERRAADSLFVVCRRTTRCLFVVCRRTTRFAFWLSAPKGSLRPHPRPVWNFVRRSYNSTRKSPPRPIFPVFFHHLAGLGDCPNQTRLIGGAP